MAFNDKINQWAKAHVFYNMYDHEVGAGASREIKIEHEWRLKAIKEAPNGRLLVENSFFKSLSKSSKIYLLHITPNLDQIKESGSLYSSGGCLIGGVYAIPIFKEGDIFRVHNLGRYIIEEEAPRASYMQNKAKPNVLIIELTLPANSHNNLIGIDYIRLGDLHLNIYRELEYLLSFSERLKLQNVILNRIKRSLSYLNLANCRYACEKEIDPYLFFDNFIPSIEHLPILGYMYFEVVSEYLMLYADSEEAKRAYDLGEFDNYTYKNMMFELLPDLLTGRSLGTFCPSVKLLSDYIEQKKIISHFDERDMVRYLADRLIFLSNSRLLNEPSSLVEWDNIKWDFDTLTTIASPLLGHLVHREFRNFGRYPDFYFYFDQFKALQIWNYWNHMDVAVPFNGFFPKGESGINPACPHLKYQVFLGKNIGDRGGNLYVEPGCNLKIKIIPRLVNIKYTTMRSRDKASIRQLKASAPSFPKSGNILK